MISEDTRSWKALRDTPMVEAIRIPIDHLLGFAAMTVEDWKLCMSFRHPVINCIGDNIAFNLLV